MKYVFFTLILLTGCAAVPPPVEKQLPRLLPARGVVLDADTGKPIPGGLKLLRADVNYYKDELAGKLEIAPEDPGSWHLHSETTETWARHLCAEVLNDEKGLWEPRANRANHGWDCSVYNLIAWDVLGVRYIKRKPGVTQKQPTAGAAPQGRKRDYSRPSWLDNR